MRNCITEQLKQCKVTKNYGMYLKESEEHHKVVFASTKSLINDSVGCQSEATIVGPRGNKYMLREETQLFKISRALTEKHLNRRTKLNLDICVAQKKANKC